MDVFALDANHRLTEALVDPNPKHTAYERSKQAAEREAEALRARGLHVVYLNPAAVYGPSPVHVSLNSFLLQVLQRKVPLLPPGGVSVAFVDSVARAHLVAAERGRSGERYLLADAHVSMKDLATAMLREAGMDRVPPTAPALLLKALAAASEPLARAFNFTPLVARGPLAFVLWTAFTAFALLAAWGAYVWLYRSTEELELTPIQAAEAEVERTAEHERCEHTLTTPAAGRVIFGSGRMLRPK